MVPRLLFPQKLIPQFRILKCTNIVTFFAADRPYSWLFLRVLLYLTESPQFCERSQPTRILELANVRVRLASLRNKTTPRPPIVIRIINPSADC